ncbi:3' terminal RNA ribose 2'-O-methyltransferase Hen1 [Fulvivirga ligni]|uniref:3' terminal RNA ribose 2'-O-methyltransferase Hen1 n=1 Tax=Fulvivirga ligni TaxID=2904246 RepID=UPI001F2C2427|nr:3' terminal RNA ribose 2'-O-methyltransferase Hen1 [Fulvivirga ligni]UII19268.1 3' terminal RNA ribose 2'-O-methyltransferase Hen1 [Fulvivirga ligni]
MLLKISTNRANAREVSFLFHKHPDRLQSVELPFGKAHIFYPKADQDECAICLVLDINPVSLTRNNQSNNADFALSHYVNDRPYVASSYMSVAISKAFSTAMNGTCKDHPELVNEQIPFDIKIAVMFAPKGGEILIRRLFEPLNYEVEVQRHTLDEAFPEWGESRYFSVNLKGTQRLMDVLTHLYVLIPSLDTHKHYWVSNAEVEKLLRKGENWLAGHPEKDQITKRYLKGIANLTRSAFDQLNEAIESNDDVSEETQDTVQQSLHQQRLQMAFDELKRSGATTVIDLGCGEGKLLKLFLKDPQFTKITGMDVSHKSLQKVVERLHLNEISPVQKERISLFQGALTYRDERLNNYEAAALIEVIEHLDPDRIKSMERVVFEYAKPNTVVLTTPNSDYNELYESLHAGQFRHTDHRFEWSREEFKQWVNSVCENYAYEADIKSVGDEVEAVGAPFSDSYF